MSSIVVIFPLLAVALVFAKFTIFNKDYNKWIKIDYIVSFLFIIVAAFAFITGDIFIGFLQLGVSSFFYFYISNKDKKLLSESRKNNMDP